MSKILITGGNGQLGRELKNMLKDCVAPTRDELNICHDFTIPDNIGLIVHCAAYTKITDADYNKQLCYDTNVIGTRRLAYFNKPIIYMSTPYIFDGEKGNYKEDDYPNPLNYYGFTKLLGEKEINYGVIIRTAFKTRPFKFESAFVDQYATVDYADMIIPEIVKVIENWQFLNGEVIHIGTERKSLYDLAIQTKPNIAKAHLNDEKRVRLPRDYSLDSTKWNDLCLRWDI